MLISRKYAHFVHLIFIGEIYKVRESRELYRWSGNITSLRSNRAIDASVRVTFIKGYRYLNSSQSVDIRSRSCVSTGRELFLLFNRFTVIPRGVLPAQMENRTLKIDCRRLFRCWSNDENRRKGSSIDTFFTKSIINICRKYLLTSVFRLTHCLLRRVLPCQVIL